MYLRPFLVAISFVVVICAPAMPQTQNPTYNSMTTGGLTVTGAGTFSGPTTLGGSTTLSGLTTIVDTSSFDIVTSNYGATMLHLPESGAVTGTETNVASGLLVLDASAHVAQANLTGRASNATTVAAPTAPASTSAFAMQGLAGTITPATSGTILITISGTIVAPTGTTVNNGITYQISYGTGSAPANAGVLTGTQVGLVQTYTSAIAPTAAADVNVPFGTSYLVTGPIWDAVVMLSAARSTQYGVPGVSPVTRYDVAKGTFTSAAAVGAMAEV